MSVDVNGEESRITMIEVNNSGADPPAAINVAPATSGLIPSWVTKKSLIKNYLLIVILIRIILFNYIL